MPTSPQVSTAEIAALGNPRRPRDVPIGMKRYLAVLVLLLAGLTTGCGSLPGAEGGMPDGLAGPTWLLRSGSGPAGELAVPDGVRVTLQVEEDGSVGGVSACNHYFGDAEVDGDRLRVGGLGGTEMGCDPAVMALERDYLDALGQAARLDLQADVLTITGSDIELVYDRQPDVPTAELTDTTWQLKSLLDGGGPDGTASSIMAEAELYLDGTGTINATTGCGGLTGTWIQEGDAIRLTASRYAHGEADRCVGDLQHEHVLEVLGDGFTVEVEGQTLTVWALRDERGLQYQAS
ncbi:META domain-containing protein [Egicoccus sp. AB-alg2]|uniref:META domain-containing protein n=1 Tax=Egicoccus sp. AB-alg2 TaxID=3242693 RepID=UPI00359D1B9F